jgi:hypothetical protein
MATDLSSMVSEKFRGAIASFALSVVRIDDSDALLLADSFALRFSADRDGVEVSYIERDKQGELSAFTLRPLVMKRFTAEDRANFGTPMSLEDRWNASLKVYASGLEKRCRDVLTGEKNWLERDAWSIGTPDKAVTVALRGALNS